MGDPVIIFIMQSLKVALVVAACLLLLVIVVDGDRTASTLGESSAVDSLENELNALNGGEGKFFKKSGEAVEGPDCNYMKEYWNLDCKDLTADDGVFSGTKPSTAACDKCCCDNLSACAGCFV